MYICCRFTLSVWQVHSLLHISQSPLLKQSSLGEEIQHKSPHSLFKVKRWRYMYIYLSVEASFMCTCTYRTEPLALITKLHHFAELHHYPHPHKLIALCPSVTCLGNKAKYQSALNSLMHIRSMYM